MSGRTRYEANVCVLLRRRGRWLLTVRAPHVAYAPGMIGMVGGHVEPVVGKGTFETTVRREALEETGLDLTDVTLHYLSSELYRGSDDQPVLTVTYAAELPAGVEPGLADPDELVAVGWWTVAELLAADNGAPWLPPLLIAAEELLDAVSRR
ncbi:MAG TPA: NUDIX domain-containing protein [Microlunatus sp.]